MNAIAIRLASSNVRRTNLVNQFLLAWSVQVDAFLAVAWTAIRTNLFLFLAALAAFLQYALERGGERLRSLVDALEREAGIPTPEPIPSAQRQTWEEYCGVDALPIPVASLDVLETSRPEESEEVLPSVVMMVDWSPETLREDLTRLGSVAEVARLWGVSTTTVRRRLKAAGIPLPSRKRKG